MIDARLISIETRLSAIRFEVDAGGKLWQLGYGAKDEAAEGRQVAYPAGGNGWVFEPAIQAIHADGNTSTDLRVIDVTELENEFRIDLRDPEYPFFVSLNFRTYPDQDVIESWTEIWHEESGVVTLGAFASFAPAFGKSDHWLTQFHGDWADEVHMAEEKLGYGIKVLDSKLMVRAQQFRSPYFLLSRGTEASEDEGEVFGGALSWSGSFQFLFEKLPSGDLRAKFGMNPYGSAYRLKPSHRFTTPKMVMGWSGQGKGHLSRNFHTWARHNALRDGDRPREILLNNWEATYFDFDEAKVLDLMEKGKDLGMEMFLLDDGWFGQKYPRDGDDQGLGDWIPDVAKLPNGISPLCEKAQELGLRFGIWMEPEMVSPRSELFEVHPDWAIQQPKRDLEVQRNQLVLDLLRPEVREYVFDLIDRTLSANPGISYLKWDCNRYVTQPGSTYLSSEEQSHLSIDYTWALYEVLEKVAERHPQVELMMCAGGGGRVDYGSLKYAHEFWPSDMTDPARRVFIQWGYSHFFPAISMGCHVTDMGKRSLKFAFDVAMSGRLGMDVDVSKLNDEELSFSRMAVEAYKDIREVVQLGTQYRLESPYAGPRSGVLYSHDCSVVVFIFSLGEASGDQRVQLKGLQAVIRYRIEELLPAGPGVSLETLGSELMADGLDVGPMAAYTSRVFKLEKQ